MDMKNLEESRAGFTKSWRNEKKLFEKLILEVSMKWKKWRGLRKCELTNSPGMNFLSVRLLYRSSLHKYRSCRKMDCMSGSTEFQDVNSICSQPAVVLSPCGMLSHDHSLRPDTWNLVGTPGNVFGNPCAVIDSSSTPYQGMLHSGT